MSMCRLFGSRNSFLVCFISTHLLMNISRWPLTFAAKIAGKIKYRYKLLLDNLGGGFESLGIGTSGSRI